MVKMAARNNWRGIYTDLIPHCMTLSWWQMALVASQGTSQKLIRSTFTIYPFILIVFFFIESTWYGLVRSILALVCVFILFPITGIFLPFITIGNDFETIYQIIQLPVILTTMWILHIVLQYLKRKGFRTDTFYTYLQVI